MRIRLVALALIACAATTGVAQSGGTYSGKVEWPGFGPVAGVKVAVTYSPPGWPVPTRWTAGSGTTDKQGRFSFRADFLKPPVGASIEVTGFKFPPLIGTAGYGRGLINLWGESGIDLFIPPPVILVHDVFQSSANWTAAVTTVRWYQGRLYHPVQIDRSWTRSHADNAKVLHAEVNKLRTAIFKALGRPEAPVLLDIIAHGVGGLTARAYIANHTGRSGENGVRKCVTMRTPHLGAFWLQLLPPNDPLLKAGPCLARTRIHDMLVAFPASLRGGYGITRFYLLGGGGKSINPVEPEGIPGWPYSTHDDGFVSQYSATNRSWGGNVAGAAVTSAPYHTAPFESDGAFWVWWWLRSL